MKRIIKEFITWIASRLPWGAQVALAEGLSKSKKSNYWHLQTLAASFDISGFITNGDYGYIQGSVSDLSVFPKYARDKSWAATSISLFSGFLRDGGTYLDIGGNIGLTTIPIAQSAAVKCHVFEPNPVNFRHLTANITANCHHGNVTIHQLALFDRDDQLPFEISPTNSGDNRIRLSDKNGKLNEETWETVNVAAQPLDNIISDFEAPLVVKIDTQGAEPFIISGGGQVLAAAQLIALEFWPYGMVRMGGSSHVVIEFLRKNFNYGLISKGDSDLMENWFPIDIIVSELETYANHSSEASSYLDVFVSKSLVKDTQK